LQHLSVNPRAAARLELLVANRVMDLRAISEVVASDPALKAQMVRTVQHANIILGPAPSVEECIVELGREGMRQCLRSARVRVQNREIEHD